jgi:hypothetical protein
METKAAAKPAAFFVTHPSGQGVVYPEQEERITRLDAGRPAGV